MRIKDLHVLPKFSDGWSYLYVEHCRIDQEAQAIAIHDETGKVPVPCAKLALLMLGPGVSITHAAISVLADHGCLVVWCGEEGVRFYASGMGETRSAVNFLHQARMWAHEKLRMKVIRRFYQLRFAEELDPELTLRQIRGMEGVRVRETYARASRETGVPWTGRSYHRGNWSDANPVNRALSAANSCLYGICHAAIVSAGFSPALGFIHTGKMLSFVYDVADLYKTEVTIPVAFQAAAAETDSLERQVRMTCRDQFVATRILKRIIPDIKTVLMVHKKDVSCDSVLFDQDAAAPGALWDPEEGEVEGGRIHPLGTYEAGEDCGYHDS
ncbi:MAG: type I-E CRISPR-associated endonuclease Cas1 [Candidatus Krumholzibacteriota bacterium]|nr:type I-E CRISPR-associated endonuclease Cas1 [Candidatus Krumholzibacteriota bacterium]